MKIKILSLLGMEDVIEGEGDTGDKTIMTGGVVPPYKPQQAAQAPKKAPPTTAPAPSKPSPQPPPVSPAANAPMPDWLKPKEDMSKPEISPAAPDKKEFIEGEVMPPKAPSSNPTGPATPPDSTPKKDLSKPDGPVPDWLKDA